MPYDGLTYHLSKTPGALRMPQALVGQHNAEILGDILGLEVMPPLTVYWNAVSSNFPNVGRSLCQARWMESR